MKISILDSATLGDDLIPEQYYSEIADVENFRTTSIEEAKTRLSETDILILNKFKINDSILQYAPKLKLICVTATGFDNIDIDACTKRNVAVCNVSAYSTDSVAQLTVSLVLSLANHLTVFDKYTKSGEYEKSGVHNCLTPVFYELSGKTWGVIGLGNIGKKVAQIAKAFGCNIIAYKRTNDENYNCVDIDTLCEKSDIITIHMPLNDGTRNLINSDRISKMKKNVILVNTARGAVVDSRAVADAIKSNNIGAFGTDVYEIEPMQSTNPLSELSDFDNVLLTPHMAWGAYEARVRCLEEVRKNIDSFLLNEKRNRLN